MSPTSYQAAPPRMMNISERRGHVKWSANTAPGFRARELLSGKPDATGHTTGSSRTEQNTLGRFSGQRDEVSEAICQAIPSRVRGAKPAALTTTFLRTAGICLARIADGLDLCHRREGRGRSDIWSYRTLCSGSFRLPPLRGR